MSDLKKSKRDEAYNVRQSLHWYIEGVEDVADLDRIYEFACALRNQRLAAARTVKQKVRRPTPTGWRVIANAGRDADASK